tara:strand:+ start:402 stop:836 length:435 start_codon:yes stop_codon:yes gene_type:complete
MEDTQSPQTVQLPQWLEEHSSRALDAQIAYGRWILNSLLLVNGGAVLAITQTGDHAYNLFDAAGLWLVVGIMSTFVAGFGAWVNFTGSVQLYMGLRTGSRPGWKTYGAIRGGTCATMLGVLCAVVSLGMATAKILMMIEEQRFF